MSPELELAQKAARIAAPVFQREGWEWGNGSTSRVPDTLEMYSKILTLLEGLDADSTNQSVSSGRLVARRGFLDDPNSIGLYLELGHT